jgi:beta-lactamase regulating signal transducer with metallopeptidase domain
MEARGNNVMADVSLRLIEIGWLQFWQLTAIVGLLAVVVKFAGRKRPHLAYALWMVALCKCVFPPLGNFSATLWSWIPAPVVRFETVPATKPPKELAAGPKTAPETAPETASNGGARTAPAIVARADETDPTLATSPDDEPPEARAVDPAESDAAVPSAAGSVPAAAVSSAVSSAVAAQPPVEQHPARPDARWRLRVTGSTSLVLAAVWLAGTLLIVGVVWGRSVERRSLLTEMVTAPGQSLERTLLRLEQLLGIRRPVTVMLTGCPIGPAVSGTRHPEIYLPRVLADSLSGERLEALLAHELIHVRRGDIWIARLQLLAQAAWWFHPAVWWMNRQIDRHRERCCDEEVLASLNGDRGAYARCLVDVLTAQQALKPVSWQPGARPVEITIRRLEEIMNRPNMIHRRTPAWCWCLAALLAALALPGGRPGVAADPSAPPVGLTSVPPAPVTQIAQATADKQGESAKPEANLLKYGDGKADGKRSIGGTGEMIRFELPDGVTKVSGIKIHGSRYGYPQPPKENFEISFVKDDFSEILGTELAPYSLFHRGTSKWVAVKFRKPVELPKAFWIVLNFHAEPTKGVYVSYDTSTKGKHSRVGLAGDEKPQSVNFGGDWMIQVITATK